MDYRVKNRNRRPLFSSASGTSLRLLPPGMEWKLSPPEATGLHPSYNARAHIRLVPQQSEPHGGPPPPPWGSSPFSAHLTFLPAIWFSSDGCTCGPPPTFPCRLPASRAAARLQYFPPSRHHASSHSGHQPATTTLSHLAPPGPVQAPLSPALLHCLTRIHQFPSQPHKNKPVPLHLSVTPQTPFTLSHPRAKWRGELLYTTNTHGFHFQNHGTTGEKASYFLNHVNLGVIVLQALKIQKVPMVKVIGHN